MKQSRWLPAIALGLACVPLAHAQQALPVAQAPWAFGLGLKAWVNDWTSWEINRVQAGGSSLDAVTQTASDQALSFIPVVTVRHERFFASASTMGSTRYTLRNSLGSRTGTRSETDVNLGFDLLPGLAITTGFKQLTQNVGGRYRWQGGTLALNASASVGADLSMYGSLGVGRLKLHLPTTDAAGSDSLPASYTLGEWGLAWSPWRSGARSLALTLGYRAQQVRSRDYALSSQPVGGGPASVYAHERLGDYTQGFTLSVIGAF